MASAYDLCICIHCLDSTVPRNGLAIFGLPCGQGLTNGFVGTYRFGGLQCPRECVRHQCGTLRGSLTVCLEQDPCLDFRQQPFEFPECKPRKWQNPSLYGCTG